MCITQMNEYETNAAGKEKSGLYNLCKVFSPLQLLIQSDLRLSLYPTYNLYLQL